MTGRRLTSSMTAMMRFLSSCLEATRMWRKNGAGELGEETLDRNEREQRLRLLQIARVEPFSEPAVDWSHQFATAHVRAEGLPGYH